MDTHVHIMYDACCVVRAAIMLQCWDSFQEVQCN